MIVVDEFATLAEELPSFVPGLIAIAQRGRSLGVHLVLATQRPSGVVSPEIRANCTLRICLRTTDEADSRDVLGTTDAAHLAVDLPGRAYLRAGSGTPTPLQVARVAAPEARSTEPGPEARLSVWPHAAHVATEPVAADGATDLTRLCRAVLAHSAALGRPAPHRPWRPPLPDQIPVTGLAGLVDHVRPAADTNRARLPIGLIDRPDIQSRELLELDLADGGTWLAVGGPRSGRTTLLRTVLGEAVHRFGPDELHVHVIESGGGSLAADAAVLPHAGTTIAGEDALRTVRLIDRLAREVAARRAGPAAARYPLLLLLVDGVEALSTVLDDADPARGSAGLLRLLRDGAAVGLTCVATADRAVPGGRLAAAARQRLVLPLPDRADYAVAGIPARAVPERRLAGRALLGEDALECQLTLPRPLDAAPLDRTRTSTPPFPPPVQITALPPEPVLPLPTLPAAHPGLLTLPVGPGGDEGDPLVVDLLRTGGLLVSGPPASGRSTALDAFAQHLRAIGAVVLRIGLPPTPAGTVTAERDVHWLDPADDSGARAWAVGLGGRPGVVIVDDVGTPAECAALCALPAVGVRTGVALIAAASPGQLSGHYQGPIATLRRSRAALLLCPGPGDARSAGHPAPADPATRTARQRVAAHRDLAGARAGRPQAATRCPAARSDGSEELERRTDLLRRVPGELVTFGLVDDELRVLAAEIGLEDHVDRRADVLLGIGAVDVGARDVLDTDVALDLGRASVGVVVVDRADPRVGHIGRHDHPPPRRRGIGIDQPQTRAGGGQQGRVLEFLGVGFGVTDLVELPELRRDGEDRVRPVQHTVVHEPLQDARRGRQIDAHRGSFPSSMNARR